MLTELNSFAAKNILDRLLEIEDCCFMPAWSAATLCYFINAPNNLALGLYTDQAEPLLVGFGIFSVLEPEAELLQVAVLPAFRGQGGAAYLLAQGHHLLQQQLLESAMLEVSENNHSALRLYQRFGYQLEGRRKNYYQTENGAEDALLMRASFHS